MTAGIVTLLFFLFPGVLLLPKKNFLPRLLWMEKIPLSIALSLAYWIISFWILKIIPIPLRVFVGLTLSVCTVTLLTICYRRRRLWRITPPALGKNILVAVWFLILAVPAIILATHTLAPSGADMSMHAYLAGIIYLADGFPAAMAPLVPVSQFGNYPVGFPVLVTDMMIINQLPVIANALWLSVFTYWFFAVCVYTLIRSKFSFFVSAITTVMIAWVSLTPNDFVEWGANPTILSLDFLIVASIWYLHLKDKWSYVYLFMMLYCALLIHFIVPVGLGYVSLMCLPLLWKKISMPLWNLSALIPILLGILLITLPFLTHTDWQSWKLSDTTREFVAGLHAQELREWSHVSSAYPIQRAADFLINTFGVSIIGVYGISLIIILWYRRSILFHVLFILGVTALIINADYWWLPFSPILYPKRVALLLILPMSLGIARGLTLIQETIYTHFVIHTARNRGILYGLLLILLVYVYYPVIRINVRRFTNSGQLSVVTREDIAAMAWLAQNTPQDAIIRNNYSDAGLWIPAMANRQITLYHTNPIDMDALTIHAGRETYVYVGNKTLTGEPQTDPVNRADLDQSPDRYTLVYQNNKAAIYQIIASK